MKAEQDVREILIANTIRLIAEGGFEKATTKAITYSGEALTSVKMNEVYIYRLFGNKEQLYDAVFERLDKELLYVLYDCVKEINALSESNKDALYKVFLKVWSFVVGNEERCRCYVRYYYSIYFKDISLEKHNKRFEEIIKGFSPMFKEEADVCSIMHSVLTTLLDFAIRVYNGDLNDDDTNRPHIFNVLYCTMMTYFRDDMKAETHIPQFI